MKKNSKSKKNTGLLIAIAAIVFFLSITCVNYWRYKVRENEPLKKIDIIPVETAFAHIRSIDLDLDLTGDIKPLQRVDVHPKIPGKIIEKIYVERGDFVQKGTLIASMENNIIKAQIKEAEAGLKAANASLNLANANLNIVKKDHTRLKTLAIKKTISTQQLDQINARYKAALANKKLAVSQIERSDAAINVLLILLKDHQILAPINGYISARFIDSGSMSDTKRAIMQISNEKIVKVVTSIAEQDFPFIKKGMTAKLYVDAFPDKEFNGKVTIINPTLDPGTRTCEIEINVLNQNLTLRSGMFARIHLHLGKQDALVINKDAPNRLPGTGNYYVFKVENNKVLMKNIKLGISQGNYSVVKEGLNEGDQIVIKGQGRLKDGFPIIIKKIWGEDK